MYFQRSSSGGVADGVFYVNRIGRSGGPIDDFTNAVSHDSVDDLQWRYISIGQALASVNGGTVDLDVWYDDLYIDNTRQRV